MLYYLFNKYSGIELSISLRIDKIHRMHFDDICTYAFKFSGCETSVQGITECSDYFQGQR